MGSLRQGLRHGLLSWLRLHGMLSWGVTPASEGPAVPRYGTLMPGSELAVTGSRIQDCTRSALREPWRCLGCDRQGGHWARGCRDESPRSSTTPEESRRPSGTRHRRPEIRMPSAYPGYNIFSGSVGPRVRAERLGHLLARVQSQHRSFTPDALWEEAFVVLPH